VTRLSLFFGKRGLLFVGCFIAGYFSLLCVAVPASSAAAETISLFFNEKEIAAIEEELRKPPEPEDEDVLTLGAVLYYGPHDWTVWIRDEKWTPETDRPNLRIVEVTPVNVSLSVVAAEGMPPRTIVLRPYQSYRLSTGQIAN
jgi:hypothetical protein